MLRCGAGCSLCIQDSGGVCLCHICGHSVLFAKLWVPLCSEACGAESQAEDRTSCTYPAGRWISPLAHAHLLACCVRV